MLVHQPPLASFPSLLSQDPMVNHSNLSLVSTFDSLDLSSATYPLPISNSRFLQQSVFSMPTLRLPSTAGENHTTLQIGATADLCFLITAEFSTLFLNFSWVSSPSHSPQGLFWTLAPSPQPVILMTLPHILREIRLSVCGPSPTTRNSDGLSGQVDHRAKVESRVGGTTYYRTNTIPGDHSHALYLHASWLKATAWNTSLL